MEEKKVKIKELVGKGIGSYHTKVKQQIDRIEKKNKEQNHKISILTKELDDDYITKTAEGSVISLDHSKEGMVYIDSLEGNTLVNYCTDGAKEMTLNGDIDASGTFVTTTEGVDGGKVDVYCEGNTLVNHCTDGAKELTLNGEINTSGTFVTTTEGVDGGKVDVYCEGNTLVNLYDWNSLAQHTTKVLKYNKGFKFTVTEPSNDFLYQGFTKPPYKDNTTYTFIINITKNTFPTSSQNLFRLFRPENTNQVGYWINGGVTGLLKISITTDSSKAIDWNGTSTNFGFSLSQIGELIVEDIILLEGDWTNKEIPAYFEGMKSVGQDDVSGHKVEILSNNKNLTDTIPNNWEIGSVDGTGGHNVDNVKRIRTKGFMLLPKKQGCLNYKQFGNYKLAIRFYDKDFNMIDGTNEPYQGFIEQSTIIIPNRAFYYRLVCATNDEINILPNEIINNQCYLGIEETPSVYIEPKYNTKQIPLSAPLRGLPNGVKDKFVKKEGKWYVERSCGKIVLNGSELLDADNLLETTYRARISVSNIKEALTMNDKFFIPILSGTSTNDNENIQVSAGSIYIRINKSRLSTQDVAGFKAWLQANPVTVIYELATPTYEPIENVELITYLETTHISNNSLIPCNMVVKNTGYNTIAIKPSTLYTVALDKNGSGTISANLGGTTATTTTNILTVTTPATLTSDLLTLSGKGIKGSKIRLLEGDKTNAIPGYFEGMKSVGELEGNRIKVVSSKNLTPPIGVRYTNAGIELNFSNNPFREDVYVHNLSNRPIMAHTVINSVYSRGFGIGANSSQLIKLSNGEEIYCVSGIYEHWSKNEADLLKKSFIITKNINELNKKEIPLSAPLRGLPNGVKDRFVKIGGKWYIERNCGNHTITSNSNIEKHSSSSESMLLLQVWSITPTPGGGNNIISDSLFGNKNSWTNPYHIYQSGGTILFSVPTTVFPTLTDFKTWLSNNPFNIIYQLATPTYEPIENIELITYLNTTHISNNSLIPCNMQVKNTGYNAIIKPSTLYTVALDTNKSGTIGMNLGGVKGTTTNNVATVTTPATLTDDSLRVYGKGIAGSKIRLLEGDKTGWIPSHFEGMKSCFEDKVQSDGGYKVEVLSNNENLVQESEYLTSKQYEDCVRMKGILKPNTQYAVSIVVPKGQIFVSEYQKTFSSGRLGIVGDGTRKTIIVKTRNDIQLQNGWVKVFFNETGCSSDGSASNLQVTEIETQNYTPNKSNKLQLSAIEPLRAVGNVRDKFVFKDGKLMIERNTIQITLDGSDDEEISYTDNSTYSQNYARFNLRNELVAWGGGINDDKLHCDLFTPISHALGKSDCRGVRIHGNDSLVIFYIHKKDITQLNHIGFRDYLKRNNTTVVCRRKTSIYEEIPYELQKIILEGYENGTLFIDTNIPPTVTTTYAGQTPIVSTVNESEVAVASVTSDINDIIVPYLCDMDYRIVALQLQNEPVATMNTYKLLGSTYDMIKRDILSKRYSSMEYLNRMSDYHSLGRITDSELDELKQVVAEVFNDEQN